MKKLLALFATLYSLAAQGEGLPPFFDEGLFGILLHKANEHVFSGATKCESNIGGAHCYSNPNKTEYIKLIIYPGSTKYTASYIEVYSKPEPKYAIYPLKAERFLSIKGVSIGLPKKALVEKLGKPSYETSDSLEYYAEMNSEILEKYNMPLYSAVYRFEKGKLISFKFGFDYP